MIFSDPLPHVSLRGMVISKLLVFTHQAMVVAQLTALHLFTTYREADFANHDVRFGLLNWHGCSTGIQFLSQAINAVRRLQHDACLMTSNLNILDQSAFRGRRQKFWNSQWVVMTFRRQLWNQPRPCPGSYRSTLL